ncbi:uncharacterized protein N7515_009184 [Penicillium bovifimosum]|uniref:Uncharacterized protein n=1 Tax=Penicillium bovifimosum TaxID=126998 RepID=A0A9W9KVK9_9EURO|nr:uncharacterized protein N7515_009184 [Penicillium bovifimosum]KAJ5121223.1 hypothetical protein N7515_009184 [Penicillium bovifimosum]
MRKATERGEAQLAVDGAFLEMRKFDKMKRSDYNSASEYIEEYQKQYHVLAEPHPVHVLFLVLLNVFTC